MPDQTIKRTESVHAFDLNKAGARIVIPMRRPVAVRVSVGGLTASWTTGNLTVRYVAGGGGRAFDFASAKTIVPGATPTPAVLSSSEMESVGEEGIEIEHATANGAACLGDIHVSIEEQADA